MDRLLEAFSGLHLQVYKMATGAIAGFVDDPATAPLALTLAFALGMVHALMPGHGKSIVFAYFLGAEARIGAGALMALKIAALHVGTAIVLLAIIGATVVRMGRLQGAAAVVEIASYVAVTLVGAWLLYRAVGPPSLPDHRHGHTRGGVLGYAIGLLPCPLTIVLMNYALVHGSNVGGLLLVTVMACGIATTMTFTGMLAIGVRRALVAGVVSATRWQNRLTRGLEIGGALVIVLIGASLFVRALV